ncbi:unnamed protein product [Fraxinus pennsylvanica]|uniref:DUF7705 domain-containing protein n=1 Tax=Fraxinus pennsylvanica TaxID=56036 RepID=A0AAD2E6A4_9LAMI|nr:unnamed protein product [Fraxinus pennsylvanica]
MQAWCSPTSIGNCPPYHITPNNRKIHRNDPANFPYGAYHYYCSPRNTSIWSNQTALVILTVIRMLKNWFSCYLIQYGKSTAIRLNREMVGLEIKELGSSMWVDLPIDFTSIRIQVPLLLEEYGHLLMWERKFL